MHIKLISLISLIATCVGAAHARQTDPIYVANQNPFIQIFGLPKPEAGFITAKGALNTGFLYYVSNGAISEGTQPDEMVVWDGETAQYNLRLRYGMLERLEIGIDVPYIQHSGGYLDSTIRHFHDLFSFPNDRQEEFEKNQLHYQVGDEGVTLYEMTEDHSGLGDIQLSAAVPLLGFTEESTRFLTARSLLKLPTGDADSLLGSGGTDLSMGLSYSDFKTLQAIHMVISAYGGAVYMTESEILGDRQNDFAGYGGGSLGWQFLKWLDLKVQLDYHTAIYESDLVQLGSSLQLSGGAAIYLPKQITVDLGITQNTLTDATPDVGFYLFIRHQL